MKNQFSTITTKRKRGRLDTRYYFAFRTADAMTYPKPTTNPKASGIHTPKLSGVAGTIC